MFDKNKCPYNQDGCGNHENCKGCKHDPNETSMTFDEFLDVQCTGLTCRNCKFASKGKCKRMDHEIHKFAKNPFASYSEGRLSGTCCHLCPEYEPAQYCVWLCNHYKTELVQELLEREAINKPQATVLVVYNDEFDIRYEVWASDFVNNTFINEDGTYKWIRKGYYKQKRVPKGEFNYKYVYEYPDGYIQEKANQPILMEHLNEEVRKCAE